MGLFEIFVEHGNPHPTGSLGVRPPDEGEAPAVTGRAIVAAVLLGAWLVFLYRTTSSVSSLAVSVGITAVYLAAAYVLRPEPDLSNVGWAGGLIDNPFRFSDDYNRFLAFLQVALWPGRFVGTAIVDVVRRHSRRNSAT